jgi:hypothetical protein
MTHATRRTLLLACAATLALCGCIRRVELRPRGIVAMNSTNSPTRQNDDGSVEVPPALLIGKTQTLPYDGLLWRFTRLPFVRATDTNRLVMLDTGLDWYARVTLDVAAAERHPTLLDEAGGLAYVERLRLGKVEARSLPAVTWDQTYEYHIAFIPIYRMRGWILGNATLAQAKYVAFDNPGRRVTIGQESFAPRRGLKWSSYPMRMRGGRPMVDLPLAGQTISLLPDSAGGPKVILERPQWEQIRAHVRVRRTRTDSYPTWDGFEPVDEYTLERLQVGPVTLRNAVVWVRRAAKEDLVSTVGLGPFDDCVVRLRLRGEDVLDRAEVITRR